MEDNMSNANAYSVGGDHRSSDEISLLLNQILHRSSLYSPPPSIPSPTMSFGSSFAAPLQEIYPHRSKCGSILAKEGIYGFNSSDGGVNVGDISGNVRGNGGGNPSSFSIGGFSENETDEYDCESEEGLEAFVEEVPVKPTGSCSSSKRSRAAEVHNLSEKRRRSRINEKMKALQNLIPNSNKTDKASMLDEAIEYLKQLQLQVQMLSMRNGINLHPMCLPRLLQPIQQSQFGRGFSEDNGSQQMNTIGSLPLNQENSKQTLYDLPKQCTFSNQFSSPNMLTTPSSEISFGIDSSVRAHFDPFPLPVTSGEIGREDGLSHQHLNADHSARIPQVGVARATVTRPFETQLQASNFKAAVGSSGAWVIGRDQSESVFSKNIEFGHVLSPSFQGTQTGTSVGSGEIKIERHQIWNSS